MDYLEHRSKDQERRTRLEPFAKAANKIWRTRSRSRIEADFLRRIGTPERKIGPVED